MELIDQRIAENEKLVKEWLESLILDEYREVYHSMNKEQQRNILFALKYNSRKDYD